MAQQSLPASSNLNSENGAASLESVDVAGAVALMGELAEGEGSETSPTGPGPDRDAAAPADDEGEDGDAVEESESEEGDGEEGEPEEPSAEDSDAPEFWSAEDKAAWNAVPPELRPVLKKYEQQRVEFVNEKAREAARSAPGRSKRSSAPTPSSTRPPQWWQQAGPALQRAFADKWSQVNWTELAEKNPGEWARLNQIRMDEAAVLAEANRRGAGGHQASRPSAPSRPSSTPSAPSTPSSRTSCPTISAARNGARRPTTSSASSCSPRASRPTASTRSMRPRSSRWRSPPCDSSRPRRRLRPS